MSNNKHSKGRGAAGHTTGSEHTSAEHTDTAIDTAIDTAEHTDTATEETKTETTEASAEHTDPATETAEHTEPAPEVKVTETPAASTLSIVPTAVAKEVPKVRLFWQKACGSIKESTLTPIKDDEVFVRTAHTVGVIPAGAAEGTAPVIEIVYSMKRGKRIYYTPSSFITDAQRVAADLATNTKNAEKETAAKVKADEKLKKEQAKKDAAAAGPKVVAGATIVAAPAAATETATEEVK